jgi:hypothetical protein
MYSQERAPISLSLIDRLRRRERPTGVNTADGEGRGMPWCRPCDQVLRLGADNPMIWLSGQSAANRISLQRALRGSKLPPKTRESEDLGCSIQMCTYTATDLRRELIRKHGGKLYFLFSQFDKKGILFEVKAPHFVRFDGANSRRCAISSRFDGDTEGAYVDEGAPDLATATDWALDALRIWAGCSKDFAEIGREWAKNSPECKYHMPAFIGTTIDWLYLFSGDSSPSRPSDMYPVYSHSDQIDLFNLYCWIFFNRWSPLAGMPKAMVNIPSNTGLNRKYWDIGGADYDQTHHFAGYFWWGAHFGTNSILLKAALFATGEYSWTGKPINPGDIELGIAAAKWGSYMKYNPGYIGKMVEADLR